MRGPKLTINCRTVYILNLYFLSIILHRFPRVDRLCGDTCSYVCPQTWLEEARTNIGLSPTMGFLNENESLACFAI